MDNIKFVVEQAHDLKGASFKSNDVSVYLNDQKLPHSIFNAAMVLPIAKYHIAEFDLFTCSCGVAGCAGFQEPIIHRVKNGVVTWTLPEFGYKTEKKVYEFSEVQFKEAFAQIVSQIVKLEQENIYHVTLVSDEGGYVEVEETSEETRFEVRYKIEESMQWYETYFQANQNLKDMLEENYPDLMNKEFMYTYEGHEGQEGHYTHKLEDIVCRVLNQFPRKVKEIAYLNKCKKVVQAIIEFMAGDNKKFKKFANESYEKKEMSSYSIIHFDFNEVKEEDFEFDKVGLVFASKKERNN